MLTKIPSPGLYRIFNKNSNLLIDVDNQSTNRGAKVHQWAPSGNPNQIWELVPVGGDTFKFRAAHSGLALNLPNATSKPGAGMWQWTDDGTPAGSWRLEPKGNGWYFIRSVASNQVLAVDGMSKSNGGLV